MDIASIVGIVLGLGAVFGGAALEGLHMGALIQPTAAIIVLGGTAAATFVSFPMGTLIQAVKDDAVLTNAALRWFRQRRAGVEIGVESNIIAFPVVPPFAPDEQAELPLAAAC